MTIEKCVDPVPKYFVRRSIQGLFKLICSRDINLTYTSELSFLAIKLYADICASVF